MQRELTHARVFWSFHLEMSKNFRVKSSSHILVGGPFDGASMNPTLSFEFCSSPSTFCSRPTEFSVISLRELSHAT